MIKHIFHIDDDEEDCLFFNAALSKIGFAGKYTAAENWQKALVKLSQDPAADLIILDYNMPLKNGYEILQTLKAEAKWSQIPVVMLSTSNSGELKQKCLSGGACSYYVKPTDFNSLCDLALVLTSL
ncbi:MULTISPECIES: response regulator [Flavobacterium]|uniref:response regulator n=1 Tax=Flavobacterium TaxID=237 RepID=UPI0021140A18|nr:MULTISPECIES: response regulator [Flavobacterium]UUF12423.1 response regulator [Flavobacterium panici]